MLIRFETGHQRSATEIGNKQQLVKEHIGHPGDFVVIERAKPLMDLMKHTQQLSSMCERMHKEPQVLLKQTLRGAPLAEGGARQQKELEMLRQGSRGPATDTVSIGTDHWELWAGAGLGSRGEPEACLRTSAKGALSKRRTTEMLFRGPDHYVLSPGWPGRPPR